MNFITARLLDLRKAVSNLVAKFKKETDWEPELQVSKSPKDIYNEEKVVADVDSFMEKHFVWTQDEVYGLLDNVQTVRHMNWQIQSQNITKGDCDDAATYTAYLLLRMCKYVKTYRINMLDRQHVVCIANFNTDTENINHCYVFSNGRCHYETKSSNPKESLRNYRDDKISVSENDIRVGSERVVLNSSSLDHVRAYPEGLTA
jgi:hypothetical protein